MPTHNKFVIVIPPQDITLHPGCLLRLAAGDRAAFDWLYKNYSGKVFDYASLLVNDRVAAEDVVQDVFVKIWLKRSTLESVVNFNSWLYALVRNHVLYLFDRRKVEERYLSEQYYVREMAYCPYSLQFRREVHGLVKIAVRLLTPKQRLVYLMQHEEGMNRRDVGHILRISPNTVKNHDQKTGKFIKEFVRKQLV